MQTAQDITALAMDLPRNERLFVAQRLWESCNLPADLLQEIDNQIAEFRAKALDDGSDPGLPASQAIATARAAIKCK